MKDNKIYLLLIVLLAMVSTFALFGGIMEPDSALYASISKNIVDNNDWVNLYVRGSDWLDKPHLTFWIAAISFKVFGVSAFAYKLPSFLFGLLGAFYTYKVGKNLYGEKVGLSSALIFLSSLHVLVSTFDVRAEIYITTFTLAAIYHYYRAHQSSFWHIIAGSFFAACAIMIKGIFVLVPVLMGFIVYWVLTRQFKEFLKLKWYIAIVLVFIFIIPELYTLYIQFDLHPEKVVFGKTGVSGIKFFFWDSQFGRFLNTGPIKGRGDISFFLHTTIWAFLPWSFLFYAAVASLFKKKNRINLPDQSIIIWASALITFLLFSFSKFQLPHYILIILPQFSIVTSLYISKLETKGLKIFSSVQNAVSIIVIGLLIALSLIFDVEGKYIAISVLLLICGLSLWFFRDHTQRTIMVRSSFISIGLMIFLSVFFYPNLLRYQAGMHAGEWLKNNHPFATAAVLLHSSAFSFDLYAPNDPIYFWSYKDLRDYTKKNELVIYTPESELKTLMEDYHATVLKTFEHYHITRLKSKFLNAKTRSQVLERFYLVKLN